MHNKISIFLTINIFFVLKYINNSMETLRDCTDLVPMLNGIHGTFKKCIRYKMLLLALRPTLFSYLTKSGKNTRTIRLSIMRNLHIHFTMKHPGTESRHDPVHQEWTANGKENTLTNSGTWIKDCPKGGANFRFNQVDSRMIETFKHQTFAW